MMDKAKMRGDMQGAYAGFQKPNPAKLTPLGVKTKVLNKATEQDKEQL